MKLVLFMLVVDAITSTVMNYYLVTIISCGGCCDIGMTKRRLTYNASYFVTVTVSVDAFTFIVIVIVIVISA